MTFDQINKRYSIVLADPPWSYTGQQDKWGAAAKFYPTMTNEDIFKLPVKNIMQNRSILFLWATSPKLHVAIEAISRWGLFYRGVAFVWVKTKKDGTPIGAMGVRPSIVKPLTEFVLAASPQEGGRPLPLYDESIQQTIFAPKTEHSVKPKIHLLLERMYPNNNKIELFARGELPSKWDGWGDECTTITNESNINWRDMKQGGR